MEEGARFGQIRLTANTVSGFVIGEIESFTFVEVPAGIEVLTVGRLNETAPWTLIETGIRSLPKSSTPLYVQDPM